MSKRTKVGDCAIEAFQKHNTNCVMWGDAGLLDTIGCNAGFVRIHPLDRWQKVLNALDRDERFRKGRIRIDFTDRKDRWTNRVVRGFWLKQISE